MYYLAICNSSEANTCHFIGIVILFHFSPEKLVTNYYMDNDKYVCINTELEYIQ